MDGRPLEALPEREQARRRAVLPQQSQLHFAFSALEVVLMGRTPHLRGAESARDWEVAHAALRTVGMDDFADRDVPTLSGGEQQRVHLARALAQIWTPPEAGHRYLLLDEPTASLDLAHQHQVLRTAAGLAADGVGVLAILHDLNLAAQYADRLAVLRRGRLLADGPPADVLDPALVHAAFDVAVTVLPHPCFTCPLVVALPTVAGDGVAASL
jgi:iron complex transport system ATP-binding protein